MRPRRVFAYVRVSSDEQERSGTSLASQEDEARRYAQHRGWPAPVVRREVESGSAERVEHRTEYQRLLRELEQGDVVLVSRVDRWGRDLVHVVASVRELVARGVTWISIGDSLDASTAHGMTTLGMMAWAADTERSRIRERTVGTKRKLRDAGCWPEGKAPRGYLRDPSTRRLVVDPPAAELVASVFASVIAGESLASIVARLRANGHRWADKKGIGRMLHARWYLGETRRTDGSWKPSHPPIVDLDTWHRAHRALESRRNGGRHASAEPQQAQEDVAAVLAELDALSREVEQLRRDEAKPCTCGHRRSFHHPDRGCSGTHPDFTSCLCGTFTQEAHR